MIRYVIWQKVISAHICLFSNEPRFSNALKLLIQAAMSDKKPPKLTREERLAANLRANLRRRKAVMRKKTEETKPSDKPKP